MKWETRESIIMIRTSLMIVVLCAMQSFLTFMESRSFLMISNNKLALSLGESRMIILRTISLRVYYLSEETSSSVCKLPFKSGGEVRSGCTSAWPYYTDFYRDTYTHTHIIFSYTIILECVWLLLLLLLLSPKIKSMESYHIWHILLFIVILFLWLSLPCLRAFTMAEYIYMYN